MVIAALVPLCSFTSQASEIQAQCIADIKYLPQFLLKNDTGANDHLAQLGQKHLDNALSLAVSQANKIDDANACRRIIQTYLKSWRHGHLSVAATDKLSLASDNDTQKKAENRKRPSKKTNRSPKFERLSDKTILFTLASFGPQYRLPLIKLLKDNRPSLLTSQNWIIDVRTNHGGADTSYEPLLPWIMATEHVSVGAEWLVTPTNLKGQKTICSRYDPDNQACFDSMDQVVDKMEKATNGQFVQDQQTLSFHSPDELEAKRPTKVAVLIDRKCGSSCEEFLLTVRQSFNVKLLGRRTYGSLDYSNLRPHLLPSANFELYYATSKSLRLPDMPVDIAGVIPDIYLPKLDGDSAERKEVMRVKSWLEGGSLALSTDNKSK